MLSGKPWKYPKRDSKPYQKNCSHPHRVATIQILIFFICLNYSSACEASYAFNSFSCTSDGTSS